MGESLRVPLFVDLDYTLTRANTLLESICGVIANRPRSIWRVLWSLPQGPARFKDAIASIWLPDARILPYNSQVLEYLKSQRAEGRRIYLATGANHRIASQVANHLQLFDGVIASDRTHNRVGSQKLAAIRELVKSSDFSYAGGRRIDLRIWKAAAAGIVVGGSKILTKRVTLACRVERTLPTASVRASTYLRAVRAHQWVKNLLLFLPVLPVLTRANQGQLVAVALGFVAFCFCSSSVYIVNDLLDLQSDRVHSRKRNRPFASGDLSISKGVVLALSLLVCGLGLAAAISKQFVAIAALYLLLTAMYSLGMKRIVLVDVLILASLYTVRVCAGAAATHLALSFWILGFSMSLFVSLAFVKRYAEVRAVKERGEEWAAGRGYRSSDLELIQMFGVCSGMIAVLILGFYIEQSAAQLAFRHPIVLGLLCPLLLYWVFRVWIHAHRGIMNDDPTVFAIKDVVSRYLVVLAGAIVAAAAF
jgi:4-hydroxybenzoate polyprenyltransferase